MREKDVKYNADGIQYVPPKYIEGKRSYVEYWVFDFDQDKLVRRRKYISDKSKTEARKKAKIYMREIDYLLHEGFTLGTATISPDNKPPSILEAFRLAVDIKKRLNGNRNSANHRSYLNILTEYLKNSKKERLPITKFSTREINLYFDYLSEVRGNGPRTINNTKIFLRSMLYVLKDRGIIEENPATKVPDLPTTEGRYIIFNEEQIKALVEYMKVKEPRMYLYTRFIYYAFMRPIQICRLQVRDIHIERKTLIIRSTKGKGKRQRPVTINPQLMKVIESMKLEQFPGHYYVFGKGKETCNKPEHRNRFSEAHKRILEACEMDDKDLDMYSWKHTGNCNAYLAGVDIYSLMLLNGHRELKTTQIYLKALGMLVPEELKTKEW
ncbi:MAG: tyrosine-type recombinase/integrase [Bacteroidota bacterium]